MPPARWPALICGAALLWSCAPRDRDYVVRDIRETTPASRRPAPHDAGPPGDRPPHATPPGFSFATPDGWTQAAPSPGRDLELRTPDGAQVWISSLPGVAGGALANFDRWRGQLGLPPADEATLHSLPRNPLLGGAAIRVDLVAADGTERLVGLMQIETEGSLFVRMSGTPGAVEAQLDAFDRFAASLRREAPEPPAAGDEGLTWTAPPSWTGLPAGEFRLALFRVDASVRSWISVLAGDGGGAAANVARWCDQYGREPIDPAEFDGLPRIVVLGQPALFIDLTGPDGSRGMLGVIRDLGDRTIFVKMDGPSESVRAQERPFRTFCASLAIKG